MLTFSINNHFELILSHIRYTINYENSIIKKLQKGKPPKEIFIHLDNAFKSIDLTNDLNLFDIKMLKSSKTRKNYRIRKGKYRALFYIEDGNIFIIKIDKREDVYKWCNICKVE